MTYLDIAVRDMIEHNRNYVMGWIGMSGSAKSLTSIAALMALDDTFEISERVTWDVQQMVNFVKQGKKKVPAWQGEDVGFGAYAAQWQKKGPMVFSKLTMIQRGQNQIVSLNTQSFDFLVKAGRYSFNIVMDAHQENGNTWQSVFHPKLPPFRIDRTIEPPRIWGEVPKYIDENNELKWVYVYTAPRLPRAKEQEYESLKKENNERMFDELIDELQEDKDKKKNPAYNAGWQNIIKSNTERSLKKKLKEEGVI